MLSAFKTVTMDEPTAISEVTLTTWEEPRAADEGETCPWDSSGPLTPV